MNRKIGLSWLLACLVPIFVSDAVAADGLDLVTMRNGDIHNGTVARDRFILDTLYGEVAIPYAMMAKLEPGVDDEPDRITTRLGDHFSGRLKTRELMVMRVLDASLPVSLDETVSINFTPRKIRTRPRRAADTLMLQSGDRFAGEIVSADYLFKAGDGLKMVNRRDIHLLDLEADDSQQTRARLTDNSGRTLIGQLMTTELVVETRYGNRLKLPVGLVSTLGFGTHRYRSEPDFHLRRRLNPADLIRDRMRDGSSGPDLVALRGGEFMRGDLKGDGDGDEKPAMPLKLAPFAIAIHEVTFDEYDRYCEETGAECPEDESWGRGQRPVVNISWEDARDYTLWLSGKTGKRYRLPTDAEWEYAARANGQGRYWWGDELEPGRANCEGCGSLWDGEKSAPVGRFAPNPFGLHDTAGNVFEWVADCWHDSYAEAPADGAALEKEGCGKRVIRGGAWSFPPKEIRSANRWRDFPTRRSDDTGFRVARDLE